MALLTIAAVGFGLAQINMAWGIFFALATVPALILTVILRWRLQGKGHKFGPVARVLTFVFTSLWVLGALYLALMLLVVVLLLVHGGPKW